MNGSLKTFAGVLW